MKYNYILISLFFLSVFQFLSINCSNARGQAIWYISHDTTEDFHVIGTKYFEDGEEIVIPDQETYYVLVKRTNEDTYSNEMVSLKDNNYDYAKYRFYLPDIDGNHRKHKTYVIWNVLTFCETCHSQFRIKYFECDDDAEVFYNNLITENPSYDRKVYMLREKDLDNFDFGKFENNNELDRVLTDLMECQADTTPECCIPYGCLVNPTSINCVCGHNPNSAECLCAQEDKQVECNAAMGLPDQ